MEKGKVFIINDGFEDQALEIFSTREKAEAFINRFPEKGPDKLTIVERELDPEFLTFPDKSPYAVTFKDGRLFEIGCCSSCGVDHDEQNETWNKDPGNRIDMNFCAKNEKEAIERATRIKDHLIQTGEWEEIELHEERPLPAIL
jgi:hypothetical protein